jgi:hypothetical protein
MRTGEHSSISTGLTGWWHFAVRALTALTTPRADIDACDRAVEQLARNSVAGSAVHHVSAAIRRAWAGSFVRASTLSLVAMVDSAPPVMVWRAAGWMIAVAGATAWGLDSLAPIPIGPLSWIMPVSLVAAGVFVMAVAAPLSRAAADRRLRHKVP